MTRTWSEVPAADVLTWNRRVRDGGAHLWQLPFWRAFVDRPGLAAHYFAEVDDPGTPSAWACVMEWGLGPYRVALVQDGPVNLLDPEVPVPADSVEELCATLRRHARESLAAFKVPDRVYMLDEIPKTATGKVQRSRLASQLAGNDP